MPGQEPTLTPATQANIKEDVVREAFGSSATFAGLSTGLQSVVDSTGDDTFMEVTSRSKWFADISPDSEDLPTQWNELFKKLWVAKIILQSRSTQDFHAYWNTVVVPLQERIADHYTAGWQSSSILASTAQTVTSIRKSVIATLIRQRTPVFPPIHKIDETILAEFQKLWVRRKWSFRQRTVKVTIDSDGISFEVGFTTEEMTFAQLASRDMFLDGHGDRRIMWCDSTEFARRSAASSGKTGEPKKFYDEGVSGLSGIRFLPTPDKEYSAWAVIYIGPPSLDHGAEGADKETGIEKLPVEFRLHLYERVFATLMSQWGREDGDAVRALRKVENDLVQLEADWIDRGPSRSRASTPSHSRMTLGLTSSRGTGSISPLSAR